MSWVREDDGELMDAKIARLSDREYRELHALRQYVAREHPGAGGVFSRGELPAMVYATPKGPRCVSVATFGRFIELDLVRSIDSYGRGELLELETGERTNRRVAFAEAAETIRDALESDADELYRCNRWEFYNGAADRTASERKRKQRARLRGDILLDSYKESRVPTRVRHEDGYETVPASAYAHPVPSPKYLPNSLTSTLDAGKEMIATKLLATAEFEESQAEYVRVAVNRLPEAKSAGLLELVAASPEIRDKRRYVLASLARELQTPNVSTVPADSASAEGLPG